jgi:hypothetical protein
MSKNHKRRQKNVRLAGRLPSIKLLYFPRSVVEKLKYLWVEYADPFIKRWIFAPFSNKVTRVLLIIGGGCFSAPPLGYLIATVILDNYLDIKIPIDLPNTEILLLGAVLLIVAVIHNAYIQKLTHEKGRPTKSQEEKALIREAHDLEIINRILALLPYQKTRFWIERASYAGMRRDFARDLEKCEDFSQPPYTLFNSRVEENKQIFIASIHEFNKNSMGYLGAQEDTTGEMFLPPFHWKGLGGQSEEKYYEMLYALADAGVVLLREFDEFISIVKTEGFVIREI